MAVLDTGTTGLSLTLTLTLNSNPNPNPNPDLTGTTGLCVSESLFCSGLRAPPPCAAHPHPRPNAALLTDSFVPARPAQSRPRLGLGLGLGLGSGLGSGF